MGGWEGGGEKNRRGGERVHRHCRHKRKRKDIHTSDAGNTSDTGGFGLMSTSAFASPLLTLGNL